jgi:hypothetical protein
MKACRFTAHSAHACLSTAPTDRLKLSAESWQDKALRKRNPIHLCQTKAYS